jgi:hypothetical protein
MTWQEELRQLDSALAGGELSANEYRKRRDEILAAASSAQPPSPVIGPPAGPRPEGEAEETNGSENGSEAAGDNAGDNAEVTQIVNVDSGEADQTQIIDAATVGGASANGNGEATSAAGDVERTQVVTAEAPPAQPQQAPPPPQAPQQPVWATQLPDPHAATGVFPRQQPMTGPAVTPMDAQDLFTSNKAPSGARKPWLIGVTVLVVLALVGAAVWFFAFRDDDTQPAAGGDTQPDSTSEQASAPEPVDITKIELPGEPAANAGEMDISRASELKVIAPAEATLLAGAGADSLVYSGAADGDYRFLLYSFQAGDEKAAEELTGKVVDVQKQLGFQDTEVQDVPKGVKASQVTNPQASALRGVYTYGDTTIQLVVLQIGKGDVDELRVQFQRAMTAVTDAAPPAS